MTTCGLTSVKKWKHRSPKHLQATPYICRTCFPEGFHGIWRINRFLITYFGENSDFNNLFYLFIHFLITFLFFTSYIFDKNFFICVYHFFLIYFLDVLFLLIFYLFFFKRLVYLLEHLTGQYISQRRRMRKMKLIPQNHPQPQPYQCQFCQRLKAQMWNLIEYLFFSVYTCHLQQRCSKTWHSCQCLAWPQEFALAHNKCAGAYTDMYWHTVMHAPCLVCTKLSFLSKPVSICSCWLIFSSALFL